MNWEADILALTYEDRMDIVRHESIYIGESHLSNMQEVTKYENILCQLDKSNNNCSLSIKGDTDLVSSEFTVFTRPEVDVLEGDKLIITHLGRIFECKAGIPFKYISHLEVPVSFKERV